MRKFYPLVLGGAALGAFFLTRRGTSASASTTPAVVTSSNAPASPDGVGRVARMLRGT
jgi:hypothetical protein